ncbi:copper oxidase [Candidatus Parcubacteria bacterium]|nr:MAG: copper oxidase [Candidatus Parcubacteria bacterium]
MKLKYIYAFLFLVFVVSLLVYFSNKGPVDNFVKEFNNSYLSEIEPNGTIIEYDIVAAPSKLNFLGDTETNVWSYNGQIPGPVLRAELGDTIKVNFTNNLPQETTIHWHGVRVPNAMDGVPGVTQDAIEPGESFVYEFIPKDAGTFWFHPHVRSSEQVERGLYGILIVEDPNDPEYSQDLVWVVDDWLIDGDNQIYEAFNTMHDLMHDGRWGNVITVNSQIQPSFPVAHGERIRVRMINVSNARVYKPVFPSINPKVIAVDGMKVADNFNLVNFDLAPGNRLDLDITIPDDFSGDSINAIDTFSKTTYKLASLQVIPEFVDTPDFDLPKNENIPNWTDAKDVEPNVVLDLDAIRQGMQIKWTINSQVFPDVETITLESNKFNKILINNKSTRLHPMHLHGQFFKVLSRNGKEVEEDYWRDTVLVKANESVEIGLVPLDKGLWVNHCHALEHAEAGMMTIIEVI